MRGGCFNYMYLFVCLSVRSLCGCKDMFIVKHMEALQGTDEISVFSRHHPPPPLLNNAKDTVRCAAMKPFNPCPHCRF